MHGPRLEVVLKVGVDPGKYPMGKITTKMGIVQMQKACGCARQSKPVERKWNWWKVEIGVEDKQVEI